MPGARSANAEIFPLCMSPDRRNVIAVEQRVQQVGCHRHDLGLIIRPDEVARLQSFNHQPETATVPEENLDAVTTPVPEDVKRGVHRVQLHRLLNEDRQAVHAVAEIDRVTVQVNLQIFVEPEHGNLPRI